MLPDRKSWLPFLVMLWIPFAVHGNTSKNDKTSGISRRACLSYVVTAASLGLTGYLLYLRTGMKPPGEWAKQENPEEELRLYLKRNALTPPKSLPITHLGQSHWLDDEERKKWSETEKREFVPRVIESQKNIVAFLRSQQAKGVNVHVFSESLNADLDPEDYARFQINLFQAEPLPECRSAFPHGFPKPNGEGRVTLTAEQELVLAKAGGDLVLWATGELKYLYATDKSGAGKKALAAEPGWTATPEERFQAYRLRYTFRELEALSLVVKKFPAGISPMEKIVINYGNKHNFVRYTNDWLKVDKVTTVD